MEKVAFFKNIIVNLNYEDSSITCHTNTDYNYKPYQLSIYKQLNNHSTVSKNYIVVKCHKNLVTILERSCDSVDYIGISSIDYNHCYRENMVADTIKIILKTVE